MSELGDLLELMQSARGRYSTLRATIREWRHHERSARAFERYLEAARADGRAGTVMVSYGFGAEPAPGSTETLIRLWLGPPATLRLERTGAWEEHTVVSDGKHQWTYTPDLGAIVSPVPDSLHGFEQLTDPSLLLGQIDLERAGLTSVAGRAAILVRAAGRGREWHGLPGLPEGADHHELAVDSERGVVLRAVSYLDGQEFASHEMLEIAFDEQFPEDTFVFDPPPGVEILDAESAFPSHDTVTVEEAARLAAFTVLVPRRVPEHAHLHVDYYPGSERIGSPPTVNLAYWFDGARHSLAISQTGEPQFVCDERWEQLERAGQAMRLSDQYGQRLLALDRHGTHVVMTSDLDRETLVEIALSLEPAPTEPPRLVDA